MIINLIKLEEEINKIEKKIEKIETELNKSLVNYKKSEGEEKIKWKKEAATNLKKKKFYDEYLHKLKKNHYNKEMKIIKRDIVTAKKEFVCNYF
jgi:Skp family chaperone for outer membrane proteins